jgi:Fe-S cluster biosynthesis and repair protein YggX
VCWLGNATLKQHNPGSLVMYKDLANALLGGRMLSFVRGDAMGCGRSGIPFEPEENRSGRKVFCVKFQREMPGLDEPPFDNEMGQRIFENVSKEAWKMWVEQMKMIMNEYRLNLGTMEAQEFLLKQMEQYFWGEGAALPPGYVAPKAKN